MATLNKSINKSKEKTTLNVHSRSLFTYGFTEVLELLFWRNHKLVDPANKLLDKIKKEEGMADSDWQEACKEIELTDESTGKILRGRYDSIIKKLRGAGLIQKDNNVWRISSRFDTFLENVLSLWKGYKRK